MSLSQKVDSNLYRNVIGHFMSGVTVITTNNNNENFGITASAVTSLSVDPPMLIVCVNQNTGTCHAISQSKSFSVNILHENQGNLALQFSRPQSDKYKDVEYEYGELGNPILSDTLASLECKVIEEVTGGTHSVFLAEVNYASNEDKNPLAYYRGKFGHFQPYDNEKAYKVIRKKILERELTLGETVDVGRLINELTLPTQVIYYALAKLEAEQLLSQVEDGSYEVVPLNIKMLEEALETRTALELAAIEKTVGKLTDAELKELEHRTEKTILDNEQNVDADKYIEANVSLHDYTVALAGNATLLDSYRNLTAEAVMSTSLRAALETKSSTTYKILKELHEDHDLLLEAYKQNDVEAAREAVLKHKEGARVLGEFLIDDAGGSI